MSLREQIKKFYRATLDVGGDGWGYFDCKSKDSMELAIKIFQEIDAEQPFDHCERHDHKDGIVTLQANNDQTAFDFGIGHAPDPHFFEVIMYEETD